MNILPTITKQFRTLSGKTGFPVLIIGATVVFVSLFGIGYNIYFAQHSGNLSKTPSTVTTSPIKPQPSISKQPEASVSTNSPVITTPIQSAPVAAPTYNCANSSPLILSQAYKSADMEFANKVTEITNNEPNTTADQTLNQFNQAITVVNGKYNNAYVEYVDRQHSSGCPLSVSPRHSFSYCYPDSSSIDLGFTTCLSNTRLED